MTEPAIEVTTHSHKETAFILNVSPVTLWRLRKSGSIGYYRIGSRVVYSGQHIRTYLASVEREPMRTR
jgi:hypothetical protein